MVLLPTSKRKRPLKSRVRLQNIWNVVNLFRIGHVSDVYFKWRFAVHPKVVSVFLNQRRKLHTTHSWEFMAMDKGGVDHRNSLWKEARFGEDTIIANLDTGN